MENEIKLFYDVPVLSGRQVKLPSHNPFFLDGFLGLTVFTETVET